MKRYDEFHNRKYRFHIVPPVSVRRVLGTKIFQTRTNTKGSSRTIHVLLTRMSSLDELDDDYTKKKASYDNLPTFKREMTERYDTVIIIVKSVFNKSGVLTSIFQAFLSILQNEGRIEPFVDAVMSFLYRKTDFYRTLTEESQVGFPPGVPENMLRLVCEYTREILVENSKDFYFIFRCYFSKYNQKTKFEERKVERSKNITTEASPKKETEVPKIEKKAQVKSPLDAKTQDEWQNNPESHNGAVRYL